jgi:hypothetical protein
MRKGRAVAHGPSGGHACVIISGNRRAFCSRQKGPSHLACKAEPALLRRSSEACPQLAKADVRALTWGSGLTHCRLSTIEVPVHLRSPGVMVAEQASAEPQPAPRRPCRAAPSRRSQTQEPAKTGRPLSTPRTRSPPTIALAGSGVIARPARAAARRPVRLRLV